ncbi:MAG: glycogen/starch synthase [Candidatus Azobacteroides sp.]|nr:glycogen/starch synthase [Candidatus Azobacteroides sp.]
MTKEYIQPDYIFEVSWEVCNKIGGIYTVLSTKAKTLQKIYNQRTIFIGPDLSQENIYFIEDATVFPDWCEHARIKNGLKVRTGYWDIPGKPYVILIDFQSLFPQKDILYANMWKWYKVDSLHAYGDYDEGCIFAFSTALVIESFYTFYKLSDKKVIAHFNEWTTGMGALYIKQYFPEIGTLFTTHATCIGRSIAGNNKPLYSHLANYNGDQMAQELNMVAKHSLEKQTAHHVDCFTTVSDITAKECEQLLERRPDVVVLNGFEDNFVSKGKNYKIKREEARHSLLYVAENMLGYRPSSETFLIATSGRYEYKNKGIDVFIDALHQLNMQENLKKDVIAFIMVPGYVDCPRADLLANMDNSVLDDPLQFPFTTHWLHDQEHDNVLNHITYRGFKNQQQDKVKIIFVPSYLTGSDGIFNKSYYDLLIGMDATVFPSYYEPWGYTPLESIAFSVPTITTDLAGFGLWAQKVKEEDGLDSGVDVVHRTDYNYFDVTNDICNHLQKLINVSQKEMTSIRKNALYISNKAHWEFFIQNYLYAYDFALKQKRNRY